MVEQQTQENRRSGALPHALVWAVAVVLYLTVGFRFASLFALEFRALMTNLSLDKFTDTAWIPWGENLLRFAAAPLFLFFIIALLYRLLARWNVAANPLANRSFGFRILIGAITLLPYTAFCWFAAQVWAVWISVEVFWWIQWYSHIDPAMEWIRANVPLVAAPSLFLTGVWLWWLAWPRKTPATRTRSVFRWAGAVVLLFVLISPLTLGLLRFGRIGFAPGFSVFERHCGQCHANARPLYFIKTPAEWRRTVKRMRKLENVPLDDRQEARVAQFLLGMRSFSDEWTFNTRCRRCHVTSHRNWEKRRPEDWAAITRRIARYSPYYYRPDVQNQIVQHLTSARSAPDAALGLDPTEYDAYQLIDKTCSACHALSRQQERYRQISLEEAEQLVRRMSEKMPEPPTEDRIQSLATGYREMIGQPELLRRLFPHDEPVLSGGPSW